VDLVARSGLRVPVGPAAWGRPISERAVNELATSLDHSALAAALSGLTPPAAGNVEHFHPEGQANRSNMATLVWRHEPGEPVLFEMTVSIEVPGHYGRSHVGALEITLTLTSRMTAWLNADRAIEPPPPLRRRLEMGVLTVKHKSAK
jgi:hypothetical protein